jgi:hypothetical protein
MVRKTRGASTWQIFGSAVVYRVFPESYRMITKPGTWEPAFSDAEKAEDRMFCHVRGRPLSAHQK